MQITRRLVPAEALTTLGAITIWGDARRGNCGFAPRRHFDVLPTRIPADHPGVRHRLRHPARANSRRSGSVNRVTKVTRQRLSIYLHVYPMWVYTQACHCSSTSAPSVARPTSAWCARLRRSRCSARRAGARRRARSRCWPARQATALQRHPAALERRAGHRECLCHLESTFHRTCCFSAVSFCSRR